MHRTQFRDRAGDERDETCQTFPVHPSSGPLAASLDPIRRRPPLVETFPERAFTSLMRPRRAIVFVLAEPAEGLESALRYALLFLQHEHGHSRSRGFAHAGS